MNGITKVTQIQENYIYRCKGRKDDFIFECIKDGRCRDIVHFNDSPNRHLNRDWGPPGSLLFQDYTIELIGHKDAHPEYYL